MGLKIFGPGGIDQKSSDLTRDPKNLRDSLNIKYDINGDYEKRFGVSADSYFSGDSYSDVVFIKSLGEYFFRNGASYYSYKNGVKKTIPTSAVDTTTSPTSTISGDEYLNTFIFTHKENPIYTAKYDGNSVYAAGLPVPTISVTSQVGGAFAGYMLYFFDFIDAQGNQIFGPSKIVTVTNKQQNITIDTLKNSGFYEGYIKTNVNKTLANFDLTYRTLTYTSKSSDIVVGSNVVFRTKNDGTYGSSVIVSDAYGAVSTYLYVVLTVESITATEIVFTEASFKNRQISIFAGGDNNILGSLAVRFYSSTSETTGYVQSGSSSVIVIDNSVTTISPYTSLRSTGNSFLMSDVYDITTSKIRPPKCKYIAVFGDQIVCGNVLSFFDFNNKENTYTNNDLIMYSDVLTGDLGENFSEINRQLIGNTYDGQITGLVRARDSVIVFKDRSIYAVDGVLISGLYSVRKIETNEVGCSSDKSILVVDGDVLFQGVDGIYAISGNAATKVSGKLDPFFTDEVNPNFSNVVFDPTKTRSVMDVLNENYYFFCNKGVAVFNFEFKAWFLWDLQTASNGLTVDNSGSIRMFSGASGRKFTNTKADLITGPINGWIKIAWIDFSEPSLLKKFVDIRFFAMKNKGQTLTARLYRDWDESKVRADFTIDMSSASTKTILRKLDIQQAQSVSLFIGNNIVNEDFNLSGFEINGGIAQEKDKNVK